MNIVPLQSCVNKNQPVFAYTPIASILSINNLSSVNGIIYPPPGGGGGSNFASGLTIGTGSNITSLTPEGNQATTIASGSIWIGSASNHINLTNDTISFYTNTEDEIPLAITSGSNVLLDSVSQINGYDMIGVGGTPGGQTVVFYGAQTADPAGVTVTLPESYKSTAYTVILTPTAAPTIIPYVEIITANSFAIYGDNAANIQWVTMGVV